MFRCAFTKQAKGQRQARVGVKARVPYPVGTAGAAGGTSPTACPSPVSPQTGCAHPHGPSRVGTVVHTTLHCTTAHRTAPRRRSGLCEGTFARHAPGAPGIQMNAAIYHNS